MDINMIKSFNEMNNAALEVIIDFVRKTLKNDLIETDLAAKLIRNINELEINKKYMGILLDKLIHQLSKLNNEEQ